jgi:hypothetical protein
MPLKRRVTPRAVLEALVAKSVGLICAKRPRDRVP